MTVPLNEFSMLIDQFILDVNDLFFRKLTFWNSCYPAQKMKFKKKTLIWSHLLNVQLSMCFVTLFILIEAHF